MINNAVKTVSAVIAFLLAAALCGCADASPSELLSYQSYPMSLSAVYECGGKEYAVDIELPSPMKCRLTYLSPESLAGITVETGSEGSVLYCSGLEIPVPETGKLSDCETICAMLSLSGAKLLGSELSEGQDPVSTAVFLSDAGNIKVTFADNGQPLRFHSEQTGLTLKTIHFN